MSFFHNTAAHDPFAGLSNHNDGEGALEFDDTYDGLGNQLDETDDAFNDDTFGGGTSTSGAVGKDFDFFGQTAKVANAIEDEHVRFLRQQPMGMAKARNEQPAPKTSYQYGSYGSQVAAKPARSGYEKYKEPEPELQVDAALWEFKPKKPATAVATATTAATSQAAQPALSSGRKVMSLEEVEAAMRAQTKKSTQSAQQVPAPVEPQIHLQAAQQMHYQYPSQPAEYGYLQPEPSHAPGIAPTENNRSREEEQHHGHGHPVTILQRPQSKHATPSMPKVPSPAAQQQQQQQQQARQQTAPMIQPTQILQNPNRLSGDATRIGVTGIPSHPMYPTHRQQGSFSNQPQIITHPSQLAAMTEEEKAAYLEQDAKRAKRNHKIFLLSKDNGIMTPQDKNFITRIQLQQLVAATGNPNEYGTDESLNEDFYYQVHSQIRGGHRQHPSQPLNNFAQTYLYQTGSRQPGLRRHNRGPENHMQRMEQQVQRAVEAAKNKPKNKQLVIEGSLGKISFSNAKTPKPLLNIKRSDSAGDVNRPSSGHKTTPSGIHGVDKKAVLRDIEQVYNTLMNMEDHDRRRPPPAGPGEQDMELIRTDIEWQERSQDLNAKLWRELKVRELIDRDSTAVHPFIAFLSFPKGKKAIPRVFRQTTHEQRITILTMVVYNLDRLDIVRGAQIVGGETNLNAAMRENIELFQLAVMSSLFTFMGDLDLNIVTAVLGIISGLNVDLIARTRIGASILTMILSRAEIIKQTGRGNAQEWQSWEHQYTDFFNILESTLPHMFPGTVISGEDVYVWQLLAALGIGANADQQQRLVLAVKDRVMSTVSIAKSLPPDLSTARLQNVNLFMRSIGLDVELLQ